jgi:hypothetical protein
VLGLIVFPHSGEAGGVSASRAIHRRRAYAVALIGARVAVSRCCRRKKEA